MTKSGLTTRVSRSLLLLLAGPFLLAGCEEEPVDPGAEGPLVVLTRNAPTTYFIDENEDPEGYEYRLTQAFGEHLGRPVEYRVRDSVEEILEALEAGEGHIAAAGLTKNEARRARFAASPDYKTITEEIVCHRSVDAPQTPKELLDVSLVVASETAYVDTLRKLKNTHPTLVWEVAERTSTEEIIERVYDRDVECTLADSNIVALNRRYFPALEVSMEVPGEQDLVWYAAKDAEAVTGNWESFFRKARKSGLLKRLDRRFYAYVPIFDFVDLRAFKRRIEKRLPTYWPMFRAAGDRHGIPPSFLAAQGYQESHWNPWAKSPTGVRGIMMLTQSTAKRVGVDNRLDARQSIYGGAKYLAELLERLPEDIHEDDRLLFGLAAYNLGMGHLYDARSLAERLGRDKNRWSGLEGVLPLLGHKEYYTTLRYGYARGHEAVRYVKRIRNYWDVLQQTLD